MSKNNHTPVPLEVSFTDSLVDTVSCMTKEELLHVVRIQQEQNEALRALLAEQHEQMMAIGAGGVTSGKLMFNESKGQE